MNPVPPDPNPVRSSTAAFLADRDVWCPSCGYNLRGLPASKCPECGTEFRLNLGDASEKSEAERMAEYLRDHDLICRKCKTNLRGHTSNVCPTCGASYMLQHTIPQRSMGQAKSKRPFAPTLGFLILLTGLALLTVPFVQGFIMVFVTKLERLFK